MMDLLVAGGLTFTIPLTVLGIVVVAAGIRGGMIMRSNSGEAAFWQRLLFHIGLFAFMLGIFSQAVGLYQAMSAIEAVGSVSPAMLAGGLKVSMIAPLYGLLIFLVAMAFRFAIELASRRAAGANG